MCIKVFCRSDRIIGRTRIALAHSLLIPRISELLINMISASQASQSSGITRDAWAISVYGRKICSVPTGIELRAALISSQHQVFPTLVSQTAPHKLRRQTYGFSHGQTAGLVWDFFHLAS